MESMLLYHIRTRFFHRMCLMTCMCSLLVSGCQLSYDSVIDAFFSAAHAGNITRLERMTTPAFRAQLPAAPAARHAFLFGMKNLEWRLHDVYATDDGMTALVFVDIERYWPLPHTMASLLYVTLVKHNTRWYIDDIVVSIDPYIEYTREPQSGASEYLQSNAGPRWLRVTQIDEPFAAFLQRFDTYARDWQM